MNFIEIIKKKINEGGKKEFDYTIEEDQTGKEIRVYQFPEKTKKNIDNFINSGKIREIFNEHSATFSKNLKEFIENTLPLEEIQFEVFQNYIKEKLEIMVVKNGLTRPVNILNNQALEKDEYYDSIELNSYNNNKENNETKYTKNLMQFVEDKWSIGFFIEFSKVIRIKLKMKLKIGIPY